MVDVGEAAPAFSGTTDRGQALALADLRGKPVILYFYPKAGSLGCTAEAKGFARYHDQLKAAGVHVVGVSVDSVEAEAKFSTSCSLPFPLVADPSGAIARTYGVLGAMGFARRVTFFVGPDGRVDEIVRGFLPGRHLRRTVGKYLAAAPAAPPPPA
jgi:thioredoxin-dependent peroxiredoxin